MNKGTVSVKFNQPEEFMQELADRGPNVDNVLRVTLRFAPSGMAPGIQHVSVRASYLRQEKDVVQIVELRRFCGDYWGKEFDDKAIRRAEELRDQIRKVGTELGLAVRAGAFEGVD